MTCTFLLLEHTAGIRSLLKLRKTSLSSTFLSDKGSINFGDESLIYSHKESINYNNAAIDICLNIENDEAFKSGLYYINVFENNRRLGGTQIELN